MGLSGDYEYGNDEAPSIGIKLGEDERYESHLQVFYGVDITHYYDPNDERYSLKEYGYWIYESSTEYSHHCDSAVEVMKEVVELMQKHSQPKKGNGVTMTKNEIMVEEALSDSSARYLTTDRRVEIQIGSTTYVFELLGQNEGAEWYFTFHSTYGNYSGVYGDDATASGYILKDEQLDAIIEIYHSDSQSKKEKV